MVGVLEEERFKSALGGRQNNWQNIPKKKVETSCSIIFFCFLLGIHCTNVCPCSHVLRNIIYPLDKLD